MLPMVMSLRVLRQSRQLGAGMLRAEFGPVRSVEGTYRTMIKHSKAPLTNSHQSETAPLSKNDGTGPQLLENPCREHSSFDPKPPWLLSKLGCFSPLSFPIANHGLGLGALPQG